MNDNNISDIMLVLSYFNKVLPDGEQKEKLNRQFITDYNRGHMSVTHYTDETRFHRYFEKIKIQCDMISKLSKLKIKMKLDDFGLYALYFGELIAIIENYPEVIFSNGTNELVKYIMKCAKLKDKVGIGIILLIEKKLKRVNINKLTNLAKSNYYMLIHNLKL